MICYSKRQALELAKANARGNQLVHVVFPDKSGNFHCEVVAEGHNAEDFRPCTVVFPDGETIEVM